MIPKRSDSTASTHEGSAVDSSKGRVQHWIHQQVAGFLQKWEGSADQNPALSVVKKLLEATQELDPSSVTCLSAIEVSVKTIIKIVYSVDILFRQCMCLFKIMLSLHL